MLTKVFLMTAVVAACNRSSTPDTTVNTAPAVASASFVEEGAPENQYRDASTEPNDTPNLVNDDVAEYLDSDGAITVVGNEADDSEAKIQKLSGTSLIRPSIRLKKGLGPKIAERLVSTQHIVVARLNNDEQHFSKTRMLTEPNRIGYYPTVSERILSSPEVALFIKVLNSEDAYRDFHRSRCRIKTMYGARFGKADAPDRIDAAFYPNCDSLDFFWFARGSVDNWNATFIGDVETFFAPSKTP